MKKPLFLSVCLLLLFNACKDTELPSIEINSDFEMTPPIARDIQLYKKDDELVIAARFVDDRIKEPFHAIMVNDEKVVLRDDGEGGDAAARDGVFTIKIPFDENFEKDLNQLVTLNKRLIERGRNIFKWNNRSPVLLNEKLDKIKDIDLSKGFDFDPDIFFNTSGDPLLKSRSLMITDLSVVEDPSRTFNPCTQAGDSLGAWTFQRLITEMANTSATGVTPQDFIKEWLGLWMNFQIVNGDNIAARTLMLDNVIIPWIMKSNPSVPAASVTEENWRTFNIKLRFAPFKLLAIVNRLDLRGNSGYAISNAGEGRFVFGVIRSDCAPLENPGKFAVIFEYGINIITCSGLKSYAQQWHDLIALEPGTTAYNNALENITNVFTLAGTGGAKPNGSSLNQIRTNELALDIFPWELREFAIDPATHKLVATTVKQTPRDNFSGSSTLAHYANSNAMAILNNTYVVPEIIPPDTNFLGARAHTNLPSTIWDAEPEATGTHIIHDDTVRHLLSLNTCNGCHGGEGKTSVGNLIDDPASTDHDAFLHITPRSFGTKATLSAFLTGDPADAEGLFRVNDPALRPNPTTPWQWTFNDLQRRADDLEVLTMTTCKSKVMDLLRVISFKPVNMVH